VNTEGPCKQRNQRRSVILPRRGGSHKSYTLQDTESI
jgi:hypothetical protein